jgi:hypothetical protein
MIPKCKRCQIPYRAARDYPMSDRSSVFIKVWRCQGCGETKLIYSAEERALWDAAELYEEPQVKRDFESIHLNPNAPLGRPMDLSADDHDCACSDGGCPGKCASCTC